MLIDNEFHGIDLISTPPRLKQIADNNTYTVPCKLFLLYFFFLTSCQKNFYLCPKNSRSHRIILYSN